MKNIYLLLLAIIVLTSVTTKSNKINEKAPETKFLRQVESAITVRDADKLMSFMEQDYKRSQHDEFLEGRTVQFLNEFFGSEIEFTDIKLANLINYELQKGSKTDYDVFFKIITDKKEVMSQFFMRKNLNTNTFALYGAVG